jgi:hypothetical protein
VVSVLVLILAACGFTAPNPAVGTDTALTEPSAADAVETPDLAADTLPAAIPDTSTPTPTIDPALLNPLTGLPVDDPALIQRRPIAVKVSNYPRTARPQAGLSYADVLFEFYQELGMTRFHAIFLGRDVEKVGPIRSGRMIDVRLQKMFQEYLVFNAADTKVWDFMDLEEVKPWVLFEGPVQCPGLCRDDTREEINSLYGNTVDLRSEAHRLGKEDIVPDLSGFVFSAEPPDMAGAATTVRVRFLTDNAVADWVYNAGDGRYYRWSETGDAGPEMLPLFDRLTDEQLAVDNVVVVYVNYVRRQKPEMYEMELYGNGKALFFRDGRWETGNWLVADVNRPIRFFGPDGAFPFKPGTTWIGLVEDTSQEYVEGDTVRIEFGQPFFVSE